VLVETQTPCYAWALIPNHFHLLLKTGAVPVAAVMRRLLSGYALSFTAAMTICFKTATNPYCAKKMPTCWLWCAIFI
jgi:hypothetical protein